MQLEAARRKSIRRLTDYQPYGKQREFHAAGAKFQQRLLMAGNQLGKTLSAAMETSMHTTGRYPSWWEGARFTRATRGICGSESAQLTKKGVQRLLLGPPESESEWGTGTIPKDCLMDVNRARGVADAVESIVVRSDFGGSSVINMASYDQGRSKWQADTLDWAWCDEEPPEDVYSEVLTRLNVSGGPLYCTFTPLLGMSKVVMRFYPQASAMPNTHLTQMTIDDVDHFDEAAKQRINDQYEDWERDARMRGIPILGSGRVFAVSEDLIRIEPIELSSTWPCIGGLDFGWDHPSAAVKLAHDRDTDVLYVAACHRARQQTPATFCQPIKPWGAMKAGRGETKQWLPWAWPHDGLQHDKGSGEQLAKQYEEQGLLMLPERATFPEGGNGVEAGITEMLDRMRSGRLKVFSNLNDWFEEFRTYHRKDGIIVKLGDDLMSATRTALMMKRFAARKQSVEIKFDFEDVPA